MKHMRCYDKKDIEALIKKDLAAEGVSGPSVTFDWIVLEREGPTGHKEGYDIELEVEYKESKP